MVATYTIFGRQVGSHVLAMATLGSLFGGSAYAMSGPKAPASKTPAINAANEEEEKFIKEFLAQVNADELKEKNAAKH